MHRVYMFTSALFNSINSTIPICFVLCQLYYLAMKIFKDFFSYLQLFLHFFLFFKYVIYLLLLVHVLQYLIAVLI